MKRRSIADGIHKTFAGLATVVLLLSMFGTVSPAGVPDCCRGKVCPIHQKHVMSQTADQSPRMDCGHEGMGLNPCSMSCSQSEDEQLQTTIVFLLPDVSPSFELLPIENANLVVPAFGLDRSIRPVIPPPRFHVSSL
jgi:hypothetical protein